KNHYFLAIGANRFVLSLVRRIMIRSECLEFGGAGIDGFVNRNYSVVDSKLPNLEFGRIPQIRKLAVAESVLLGTKKQVAPGKCAGRGVSVSVAVLMRRIFRTRTG